MWVQISGGKWVNIDGAAYVHVQERFRQEDDNRGGAYETKEVIHFDVMAVFPGGREEALKQFPAKEDAEKAKADAEAWLAKLLDPDGAKPVMVPFNPLTGRSATSPRKA